MLVIESDFFAIVGDVYFLPIKQLHQCLLYDTWVTTDLRKNINLFLDYAKERPFTCFKIRTNILTPYKIRFTESKQSYLCGNQLPENVSFENEQQYMRIKSKFKKQQNKFINGNIAITQTRRYLFHFFIIEMKTMKLKSHSYDFCKELNCYEEVYRELPAYRRVNPTFDHWKLLYENGFLEHKSILLNDLWIICLSYL